MRSHGLRWARISVAAILGSLLSVPSQAARKATVGPSTTLDSLARKFDVPKADIARANGIHVDAILADGRVLTIPDSPPVVKLPSSSSAPGSVRGDRIAARRGPGTTYLRVALLDHGTHLTVTATKNGWCQVTSSTIVHGWIRSDFICVSGRVAANRAPPSSRHAAAPVKTAAASTSAARKSSVASHATTPVRRVIKGDRVSVRKGASTGVERLTLLDDGATVTVVARQGTWFKVRLADGRTGWVAGDFVATRSRTGAAPRQAVAARPAPRRSARKVAALSQSPARRRTASARSGARASAPRGRRDVVRTAYAYRGTRYRYGGSSRGGFDCSGFTRYVYGQKGVSLPHSASAQFGRGTGVAKTSLRSGDLVFFSTTRRGISHVGIYVGGGRFVHASSARGRVRVDSLAEGYYSNRYRGARRVK